MSESNHLQTQHQRKKVASGIVYVSILLLGGAGGFVLTSSIQPPAPKSNLKAYHICLISSPTPIADFQPQIQAMEQGVCDRSGQGDRWTIFVNQQITSLATDVPRLYVDYPRTSIFAPSYECEMRLSKVKGSDASRFKLQFSIDDRTLTPASAFLKRVSRSEHYFSIDDEHTRIIQLDSGEAPDRKYLYAMIMAHEAPWPTVRSTNLKAIRRGNRLAPRPLKPVEK